MKFWLWILDIYSSGIRNTSAQSSAVNTAQIRQNSPQSYASRALLPARPPSLTYLSLGVMMEPYARYVM